MPELPASDPAVRRQLDGVVDLVRDVFGDAVVAAYLYGSAVRGGLQADSDLDILVVVGRRTTEDERAALIDGLLARSRSRQHRDRRHLEVTLIVHSDVRPWRYPPPLELQYGDWWRTEFERGERSPWTSPNPDLAVLVTTVREDGVALFGEDAAMVLDPVPRADLERAVREIVPELLPGIDEDDTRNALLTLARVWLTLEAGGIAPKDVAASWALERMPDGSGEALRLARDAYLGAVSDTWDEGMKRAAHVDVDVMREAIDRI